MTTISSLLLLLVLTTVSSQWTYPPYMEAVENVQEVIDQLKKQILSMEKNTPYIIESKLHYATLVTHLTRVAYTLNENGYTNVGFRHWREMPMPFVHWYERVYIEEMPRSVFMGLVDLDTIIDITKEVIETLERKSQKIQVIVGTLCTKTLKIDICNKQIANIVQANPERYKEEAEFMLSAGVVAKELLVADLVSVANNYEELFFLIKNIEVLYPIVFEMVKLLNSIDHK